MVCRSPVYLSGRPVALSDPEAQLILPTIVLLEMVFLYAKKKINIIEVVRYY